MRRTMAAFALATSFTYGMIGVAAAGDRPVGGCPTPSWELRATIDGATGAPSADGNGDGLSCYLEAPEGGGIFTIVDNRVRTR